VQNVVFIEIYGVRTGKVRGQFFAILCGRLLWTARNDLLQLFGLLLSLNKRKVAFFACNVEKIFHGNYKVLVL